jgi:ribonuclease-3
VKRLSFYRQFLQKELRVLIEGRGGRNKTGLKGVSKNYIPVVIPFKDGPKEPGEWVNQEHAVVVTGVSEMGVTGRAVEMASEEGVVFTPLSEDETEKEFGSDFQRHRISGTDRKAKKRWVDDLSDGLRRNDSDEERLSSLQELEKRLNYRFQEIRWLDQALTHRSFSYETDPSVRVENEVLEFLGDAVLTLAVSHLLIRKFPDAKEGELSKKRSHLVKMSFLAHLSKELQLEDYLLLGKGEVQTGGRKNPSIMANTYEALIGAFYMDAGFNQAFQIIGQHFETYLQQDIPSPPFHDYKSLLQEESQRVHGQSPRYQVLQESGPDHNKRFQASAIINGEVKGVGWGKSKKDAEQEAAKKALDEISANFQASNDNKTLE